MASPRGSATPTGETASHSDGAYAVEAFAFEPAHSHRRSLVPRAPPGLSLDAGEHLEFELPGAPLPPAPAQAVAVAPVRGPRGSAGLVPGQGIVKKCNVCREWWQAGQGQSRGTTFFRCSPCHLAANRIGYAAQGNPDARKQLGTMKMTNKEQWRLQVLQNRRDEKRQGQPRGWQPQQIGGAPRGREQDPYPRPRPHHERRRLEQPDAEHVGQGGEA